MVGMGLSGVKDIQPVLCFIMSTVSLDTSIQGEIQAGVAWFDSISAEENNPHWPEMDHLAQRLRAAHQGKQPAAIEGLASARSLYRQFGVDPTRHRPSSEALLRRVLKNQDLYQINRVVDAINWASLDMLLPIGLYDVDKVQGNLVLRRGSEGEVYEGIRRGEIHLEKRLVVADNAGACGSPTADSLRTSVTPDTTRVVAIVFAGKDFAQADLQEGLTRLRERVVAWCGGSETESYVLGTMD